jgi:hypothetical protein
MVPSATGFLGGQITKHPMKVPRRIVGISDRLWWFLSAIFFLDGPKFALYLFLQATHRKFLS